MKIFLRQPKILLPTVVLDAVHAAHLMASLLCFYLLYIYYCACAGACEVREQLRESALSIYHVCAES